MAQITSQPRTGTRPPVSLAQPDFLAYQLLHIVFSALPIVAGMDKWLHVFANWEMYLSNAVVSRLPIPGHSFMEVVGAIEILAGLLVLFLPRVGGVVVMIWLWGIVANLMLTGQFYDIALRDFALSFGALALALLAPRFEYRWWRRE